MFIKRFRLYLSLTICSVAVLAGFQANAQSSTPDANLWGTDGSVEAIATTGNKAYIGGSFTYVGKNVGSGVPVSAVTGDLSTTFPEFNGTVYTVISDGSGGWYVGGSFDKVDGLNIKYLAHVLSSGALDTSWTPQPNSTVYTLILIGDTLYAGGDFTQIGDSSPISRRYLASFDTDTGSLTMWDPAPNSSVKAFAATGTTLYVGGWFNLLTTESLTRNYFAAFDTNTGLATSWNPDANSAADVMIVSDDGNSIYSAGTFTTVGGNARSYLAELDAVTGSSTAWNPAPDNQTVALALGHGTIYVGGFFSNIGGEARAYLAEIDLVTGTSTAWNPSPNNYIYDLELDGTTLYAGGAFTLLAGQQSNFAGAINTATGNLTGWVPNVNGGVRTLALNSTKTSIFLGGDFYLASGVWRDYIAEIDLTTGRATNWNPGADSTVRALALSNDGNTVYAGGDFSNIGGAPRSRLAALNRSTGVATLWDPSVDASVYSILVSSDDSLVYVGGDFNAVGLDARRRLAAIDAVTGLATAWAPSPTYWIRSMVLNTEETRLYAGEYHRRCSLPPRDPLLPATVRMAAIFPICTYAGAVEAFDTTTDLSFWSQILNQGAYSVDLSDNETELYAGGNFANPGVIGASNYLLKFATYDGTISPTWDPAPDNGVTALLSNGRDLFVAGGFTNIGGGSITSVAVIDASTTNVESWNPNVDYESYEIVGNNHLGKLLIGGSFWTVAGKIHSTFAAFDMPVVQFAQTSGSGSQSVAEPTITVQLSRSWNKDVTVDYEVTGGTGVSGQNYTLSGTSVTIPAGTLSVNIPLRIIAQTVYQPAKTVILRIRNPKNALIGNNYSFTYQIEAGGGGGGGGGRSGGIYEPVLLFGSGSVEQQNNDRLKRIADLPVSVHSLVKLQDDGNPATQIDSAVYYVGADGYRHAFPNEKAYFTWYCDYSGVVTITPDEMARMGLGPNVIYRPGIRLVKFQTSPVVYAVARYGVLRPMASEEVAKALYGDDWNKKIDDIADAFFGNYKIGEEIKSADQFNPSAESVSVEYISDTYSIAGYVPSGIGKPLLCVTEPQKSSITEWPFTFARTYRFTSDLFPFNTNFTANRNLQEFLAEQGAQIYSGDITGNYGALTTQGVRSFQAEYDIPQTGNVGPLTREQINKMLAEY